MLSRALAALGMCLLLQGCPPPTYDILAEARGGRLAFVARGSGSWGDDEIHAEWVQIRDGSRIVWAIEGDGGECRFDSETPPFPLTYDHVPRCYRERIPARPLEAGMLYRIDGSGLRSGTGFFRFDRRVSNFEWEDVQAEMAGWAELPDPRMVQPVQDSSSTAAAPAAADNKAMTR